MTISYEAMFDAVEASAQIAYKNADLTEVVIAIFVYFLLFL